MSDLARSPWLRLACGSAALFVSCGPSDDELRMRRELTELRAELAEQRQYNADLKLRMQMVGARNRVLHDLVTGLTVAPKTAADAAPLATADSSLAALDQDLATLAATLRQSRHDVEALQAQRASLELELGRARQSIEATVAVDAERKARLDGYRALLAALAPMVEDGLLETSVSDNRLALSLDDARLFTGDAAKPSRSGRQLLARLAEVLAGAHVRGFVLTRTVPLPPSHLPRDRAPYDLAAGRTREVLGWLIAHGVPRERLAAATRVDASEAARGRLQIIVLPLPAELPDLSGL